MVRRGLFVQFGMRAERDKVDGVEINFFVDGAQIASYIDAPASLVDTVERVVIKKRVGRIFVKQTDAFLCVTFFSTPESFITLPKLLVKNRPHDLSSRYAIASSALSNIGEMFLLFL